VKQVKEITYSHEHMTLDLSKVKNDKDCKLDVIDETIKELKELKSKGVENIVDLTNRGMGRNVEYVKKIMNETGINIISSTGFYKEPFIPEEGYALNEKELAELMIGEINQGIEDTGVKARVIGEIGTGKEAIQPVEKKIFQASSIAHRETGVPIVTHTTLGKLGCEQINIFKEFGVNLDKVVISHVDLSGDLDYILRIIDKGTNVGFDTIGKINYQPEEVRINLLKELCKRGLSEKVVMSLDITRKSHLRYKGGIGYSYLLDCFIPNLEEAGIDESDIENMIKNNPLRIFLE